MDDNINDNNDDHVTMGFGKWCNNVIIDKHEYIKITGCSTKYDKM